MRTPIRTIIPDAQLPGGAENLPGAWTGKILAPVPTATTDALKFFIPAISPDRLYTTKNWQPRVHNTSISIDTVPPESRTVGAMLLPSAGDTCLVIFDNTNSPWVVMWLP